jgi:hypothetical protein
LSPGTFGSFTTSSMLSLQVVSNIVSAALRRTPQLSNLLHKQSLHAASAWRRTSRCQMRLEVTLKSLTGLL